MDHVLSSPPAPVAPSSLAAHEPEQPSAKDVGEDVVHAGPAASALPKPLFSISIVELLLLGVCQHLVGETYLFELQSGGGESRRRTYGKCTPMANDGKQPRVASLSTCF